MASITIRRLENATKERLRIRASHHGRSMEEEAREILETYDVTYVYVGTLEREAYGDAGLAKFGEFMDVAFQNGGATIYKMPDTGRVSVRAP